MVPFFSTGLYAGPAARALGGTDDVGPAAPAYALATPGA
jgi:hypothetical protein